MNKLLGVVAILGFVAIFSTAQTGEVRQASFNEVWSVITANPMAEPGSQDYEDIEEDLALYGTPENPSLPKYSGGFDAILSLISGALSAAARSTVADQVDYRPYFQKLVHANGACFKGTWEITEANPYAGYFKQGSSALFIGRISTANPQTTNDGDRSFGFAGKIFPTQNPSEKVTTAISLLSII